MATTQEFGQMARQAFEEWSDDDAMTLAAAVAYYAIFSLAPVLVLLVAIAGLVWGQQAAQGQLTGQLESLVGGAGAEVLQSSIANAGVGEGGIIATIAGAGLLLVGATGVFAQLQLSLNRIWDVRQDPDAGWWETVRKRLIGLGVITGLGFFVVGIVVVSSILSNIRSLVGAVPGGPWLWLAVDLAASFGLLTLAFAFLFRYVPDADIEWSDVWVGAAITAVLFALGKWALGLYLGSGSVGSAYGAASSLVILLAWIYYSTLILFVGAEFTQVYAHHTGREIKPDEHAIPEAEPDDTAR
jgi:membrane protein